MKMKNGNFGERYRRTRARPSALDQHCVLRAVTRLSVHHSAVFHVSEARRSLRAVYIFHSAVFIFHFITSSLYSVDTRVCPPVTAARRVCHDRVAHFIRLGCSRTPAKTASLPSPVVSGAAPGSDVSSW